MSQRKGFEELGKGYYWVGSEMFAYNFQCNPYLLADGNDAVLFDPGSTIDIQEVVKNIESVTSLDKIRYVVLHHSDPDIASAVPYLESLGMKFTIVTHWRTWTLVRYYGVSSPVYLVDEHGYSLTLGSGRALQFIPTPYLHFPGAIVTYDRQAGYLLSSDLFGAFSNSWSLYADDNYAEGMKTFHEHYMPSNDILRPVMDFLGRLEISMILPQHGSIIKKNIPEYIEILRNLDCGNLTRLAHKDLSSEGGYKAPANVVIERAKGLFGAETVKILSEKLGLTLDDQASRILDFPMSGEELWNRISEELYLLHGMSALTVLQPLVSKLCQEYGIAYPKIFDSALGESQLEKDKLAREIARIEEINRQLMQSVGKSQDGMMKDTVTGLFNEAFFRNFMDEEAAIALGMEGPEDDVLAVIGIDEGLARIEYQYGSREVEEILKGVSRVIVEQKRDNQIACRLHGATFALWLPRILFHEANDICEKIRKLVEDSKAFIEPITISIGLAAAVEIKSIIEDKLENAGSSLTELGLRRLRLARKRGGNTICSSSEVSKDVDTKARILIVDSDSVNADVIKTFLENADYFVAEAADGDEALKKISEEGFDLIISELMIPKIDGFMLKEALSHRSGTKDIPFILLSHLKDEKSVIRAYNLGISYYLRKPFLLAELLGIVQNLPLSGEGK